MTMFFGPISTSTPEAVVNRIRLLDSKLQSAEPSDILRALDDLGSIAESIKEVENRDAKQALEAVVPRIAELIFYPTNRGVGGCAIAALSSCGSFAKAAIPELVRYIEEGVPGRTEQGGLFFAIRALQRIDLEADETKRVLERLEAGEYPLDTGSVEQLLAGISWE